MQTFDLVRGLRGRIHMAECGFARRVPQSTRPWLWAQDKDEDTIRAHARMHRLTFCQRCLKDWP